MVGETVYDMIRDLLTSVDPSECTPRQLRRLMGDDGSGQSAVVQDIEFPSPSGFEILLGEMPWVSIHARATGSVTMDTEILSHPSDVKLFGENRGLIKSMADANLIGTRRVPKGLIAVKRCIETNSDASVYMGYLIDGR